MKCLAGVLSPDNGVIRTNGRLVALLELGAGFHPELSGRENVFLNGAILGMKQEEIKEKFEEIVDFSGLERFIDTPIKNYSSGMVVRLGFAIAINVDPDILIIDEVLAVGDEAFQIKCNEKIEDFRRRGKTIVLVSHGLDTVRQLCDQVLWLDHGDVKAVGNAHEVISQYVAFSNHDDDELTATETLKDRFGSGKIRIQSFQLSDGSTNKTRVFPTGTPLKITLKVRNFAYAGEGYVRLAFHDLHGTKIWQSGLNSCKVIFEGEE
jgi:ABC-2 type transport system ATP-binding protein